MRKNKEKTIENKEEDFSVLEFSHRDSKKKRRIRSLLLLLFNVLVIGIIIAIEVTSNSQPVPITDVLKTWGENWVFILALGGTVAGIFTVLGLKFCVFIKAMTGRKRLKLSFSTAILGKYYDYVTPFGSGGQPFQMFNLGRKLDVGLSTSIPIAVYLIQEFVSIVIQIVVFCTTSYVMTGNRFLEVAAYLGLVVFAAAPITILLFSLFPKTITRIANFICRVGHKLHLVKDIQRAEQKVISGVQRYSDSLKLICSKWRALVIVIVLSAVYSWAFNSIPYLVLRACGIQNVGYIETVSMSYYVYSAITIVPTPGGAGAAEGAFSAIFKPLTGNLLFWGLMLWRLCVYYITLFIGFSVTIYQYFHAAKKERRRTAARAMPQAEAAAPMPAEPIEKDENIDMSPDILQETTADKPSLDVETIENADTSPDIVQETAMDKPSPEGADQIATD